MAEAADKAAWNRTFAVVAQIYNSVREKKAEAIDPMAFYPWAQEKRTNAPPPTKEQDAMLSQVFSPKPKG